MDLDFVYKQLFDGCNACKTALSLTHMSKRKIDRFCKNFIPQLPELQYCSDGQRSIYNVNTKCAADMHTKLLRVMMMLCSFVGYRSSFLLLSELD